MSWTSAQHEQQQCAHTDLSMGSSMLYFSVSLLRFCAPTQQGQHCTAQQHCAEGPRPPASIAEP